MMQRGPAKARTQYIGSEMTADLCHVLYLFRFVFSEQAAAVFFPPGTREVCIDPNLEFLRKAQTILWCKFCLCGFSEYSTKNPLCT